MRFVVQPNGPVRLGNFLQDNLQKNWNTFRAAVAFVKRSGTRHIAPLLQSFTGSAELICGIDHQGTSKEGLTDLLTSVAHNGRVFVFNNAVHSTFHPKIYLFRDDLNAELLIGSGNLTEGGLFTNYEGAINITLDLTDPTHSGLLSDVEAALDQWKDTATGLAQLLDQKLLDTLSVHGLVPLEALTNSGNGAQWPEPESVPTEDSGKPIFPAVPVPGAPPAPKWPSTATVAPGTQAPPHVAVSSQSHGNTNPGFLMTLQRTDVGVGQLTPGASRRSPEIFIPLAARDHSPGFWGWPNLFTPDTSKPGKLDRAGVPMRLGSTLIHVNMMTWPDKHDFRLRSEAMRSAGAIDDILRMEKMDPSTGYEYYVEIIPAGTTQYPIYLALCTNNVRNSLKRYGYY